MFNEDRLRVIRRQLDMKNVKYKFRNQLLKRVENINKKPGTLRYRDIEYIRRDALKLGIKNIEEKQVKNSLTKFIMLGFVVLQKTLCSYKR